MLYFLAKIAYNEIHDGLFGPCYRNEFAFRVAYWYTITLKKDFVNKINLLFSTRQLNITNEN